MTLDTARRMIEAERGRGMEFDLAAKINEFVIRNLCTPDEAELLRREYGLAAPAVAGNSAVSAETQSSPVLLIDWGMELTPGIYLAPKFTIIGLDSQDTPLVYFPLDDRIPCKDWKSEPKLTQQGRDSWFYQKLRFDEQGHFLFTVTLIDPTPGQMEPGCYRCDFRARVVSPDQGGSLTINADGVAANLGNLLHGHRNVILNLKDTVLLAPGESPVLMHIAQSLQDVQTAAPDHEMQVLKFFPDNRLAATTPYVNVRNPETALSRPFCTLIVLIVIRRFISRAAMY